MTLIRGEGVLIGRKMILPLGKMMTAFRVYLHGVGEKKNSATAPGPTWAPVPGS